ncbi:MULTISPECIES: GTPase-associated protein 1-related protein [Actinoplanes]|uniref:GTPase-associated protein 1-related protein n=1 Tax=Actinoplanes TaxID=1865 RepID=UPI0005F2844E|nr:MULTISPECIES: GTPase-associated protein 1-related protein [Actinoplanes]GLY04326.1 hypothetical protein Acsp01_47050 [Actinoplanes sp. NBRC 101535]
MSGSFHTYVYTNCRADDGLQQRDGFQFQAVSPAADRSAMPLIQRHLLYEPAPQWMRERRPVTDYPPSLAHVRDGGLYATAAGVYLGQEPTGGREGNQLTHAIATGDPGSYGLVRPAQLFGAPFWTGVQVPGKQCPPLEPGWQPGPLTVPEAQLFVQSQYRGAALLTALLSHLRRGSDRRRVLFLARHPEPVLRWVAAATLLVPHRQALAIDFKIFTLNPAYANHRILAVHPDWATGAANLDNQLGYVVFDLIQQDWTAVERDPYSARWVQLFLAEDPYDVMDAVEVAADAEAGSPQIRPAQSELALAVVLNRSPHPGAVRPIVAWLASAPRHLIDRYGAQVIDRLLANASTWTVEELLELDEAVQDDRTGHAGRVRLELLQAEIQGLRDGRPVSPGELSPLAEGAWDAADAAEMLAEEMHQAEPDRCEALLRLAFRFGVAPALAMSEPGLQRFIEHWAARPDAKFNPDEWAGGDVVEERLRALLNRRLVDDTAPGSAELFGDQWWDTLLTDQVGLGIPLDQALVSAGMLHLDDEGRAGLFRTRLQAAVQEEPPGPAFERLAEVLWRRVVPTMAEARRLAVVQPRNLVYGPRYFPLLSTALLAGPVDDRAFQAAYILAESSRIWDPGQRVAAVLADESNVRFVIVQLEKGSTDANRVAEVMRQVPGHTLDAHLDRLLVAMVECPYAPTTMAVLDAAPELRGEYTRTVGGGLDSEVWRPAQVAMAFVVCESPFPDASAADVQVLDFVRSRLRDFLTRTSALRLREVSEQILLLGEPWPARWAVAQPRRLLGRILPPRG